jgi:hypothetical protein
MSANNNDKEVRAYQRKLVFHGTISILLGLLAGLPYTLVVYRDHSMEWSAAEQLSIQQTPGLSKLIAIVTGTERAWRMAHLEGILNGSLCLLVASTFNMLNLSTDDLSSLVQSMAVCAYGNSIASIIAAIYNVRGFAFAGSLANKLTLAGFGTAIGAVLRALFLVLKGSS